MKNALPDEARKVVGDALQGALVDPAGLSLVAKQAHWNIVGPRFRPVHPQLDEVVSAARTYADTVAERACAIGVPPDGRAETVAKTSAIATIALGTVIARMRERIKTTQAPGPVSQDIIVGLTADWRSTAGCSRRRTARCE
ncbi:DNA starvation/stationary phase protection protein [Streptantibioticus ferralitis]